MHSATPCGSAGGEGGEVYTSISARLRWSVVEGTWRTVTYEPVTQPHWTSIGPAMPCDGYALPHRVVVAPNASPTKTSTPREREDICAGVPAL